MSRRALLVSQPTTEGVAVGVRSLVGGALDSGWKVTVVSPAAGWLPDAVRSAGADWCRLEMVWQPTSRDLAMALALRRLAGEADLVHLHSSKAGALGRMALASIPRARRPACVFTPQAWSWLVEGPLATAYRAFEWAAAPLADAVIAVSEEERASGIAELGRRVADRVTVIPNGVDTNAFSPSGPMSERRADPLVICVGRLARQKGQDVAVRALAATIDPRVRLRLVGDGPDRDRLAGLAVSVGVGDRVEMIGAVDDPAPHLRAADIVVVPSRWDGLSFALLEAMACQRPVIAARVAGTSAVGDGGLLVPPDDPAALARAIDALLEDPSLRAAMGRAGRARVEHDYAADQSVQRTLEIWDELTSGGGRRGAAGGRRRWRTRPARAGGQ